MDNNHVGPTQVDTEPVSSSIPPHNKKRLWIAIVILFVVILAGASFLMRQRISDSQHSSNTVVSNERTSSDGTPQNVVFNVPSTNFLQPQTPIEVNVPFARQAVAIHPSVSQKFSISEIKNISDMEKAYGFTFSQTDLAALEQNKFVTKNLLDTNITGSGLDVSDTMREFVALYTKVSGATDYKNRTLANSVFISSDSLYNLFSILSADLLKETENKYLSDQTLAMSKGLYEEAAQKFNAASTEEDRNNWAKIRNYFAVPYALLSTSVAPVSADDYWDSEFSRQGKSVEEMLADFDSKDKDFDRLENTITFVKNLKLGAADEERVLGDLKQVYEAQEPRGVPKVFAEEFAAIPSEIQVGIPFTTFLPRGTYTSSSLRRQYFRAVQWYQQIPFLLSSKELTTYAVLIGEMMQSNKNIENQFNNLASFISYIVGESDDLEVGDFVAAAKELGTNNRDQKALINFLDARKPPSKIKSLPVNLDSVGSVTREEEMNALRGMRFMSQKFIPDSYWTSMLTQGDEAPAVNGQKLPDKASVLQVMSILGSPYATAHLTDLGFYSPHKLAIDTKMSELKTEAQNWGEDYWKQNLYRSSLWTLSGMFNWLDVNRTKLPQFMQSPRWNSKTLLTASGFWTELRHTSLLYAKQSFAERGAGGSDACDLRKVPDAPKGYIEPQAEAYDRLYFAAQTLAKQYEARGYNLKNLPKLDNYIELLGTVREYTKLQLENVAFNETTVSKVRHSYDDNKECTEYFISPESAVDRGGEEYDTPKSRWEELRVKLISQMAEALPIPVEGPILEIKDKRTAVVADIHTDKTGGILEEGTGVPRIIFVAVKDANGPRLTVGFIYSQYETISSERLTDEQWQDKFYESSSDSEIKYKPKESWPNNNVWFQDLLGNK
jgi:hypothetical protein